MWVLKLRQYFYLSVFFGIFSLSLLAPIASNSILPEAPDFANHSAAIVQAKLALDEGQFPIRVAPWQHGGLRYPVFQFYSPLPYTLAALLYKWSPDIGIEGNPYFALKSVIWLSLFIAGIYMFRLTYRLTRSQPLSILTGIVYITTPYFLININTRGAFTEAIGQGIIPISLFYMLKHYKSPSLRSALFASLSWFALITTHIITFVYTSLFIGALLLFLTINSTSKWRNLLSSGLIYIFGCLLACWFLVPIALISKFLLISDGLGSPFNSNWLTPISTLLSIAAVSPMPLPGNGLLTMPLYPSVGWPMLIAVGASVYFIFQQKIVICYRHKNFIFLLLSLFMISFFMVWSPVDFWRFLPQFLVIAQFSYRILAQTSWIGALLFAFVIIEIFNGKIDARHLLIGVLLIGLASSSWLPTNKSSFIEIESIIHSPDLGYGQSAYLVKPVFSKIMGNIQLPLLYKDGWLMLDKKIYLPTNIFLDAPKATVQIIGVLPSYFYRKSVVLTLKLGDKKISKIIYPGSFKWEIPIGELALYNTKNIQMEFSVNNPIVPHQVNPNSPDKRSLGILVNSVTIINLSAKNSAVAMENTQHNCIQKNATTQCQLVVTPKEYFIQLPILYYPKLLDVKVNGVSKSYVPMIHKGVTIVGVNLLPGKYKIDVNFVGIKWANWISCIVWLMLIGGVFFCFWRSFMDNFDDWKSKYLHRGKR